MKLKRFAVITITAIVACTPPGSATRHVQEELVELTIKGEFQLLRQGGDASPSSGCSGIGSTIEIHFEDLDTAHPYIANSKIACDRLISYPNTWIIRCEQRVVGPTAPWYWIYYDTYLDRLRWDLWTVKSMEQVARAAAGINRELRVSSILTRCSTHHRDSDGAEAAELLAEYSDVLPLSEIRVCERKIYKHAVAEGKGVLEMRKSKAQAKAAAEINELATEVYGVEEILKRSSTVAA